MSLFESIIKIFLPNIPTPPAQNEDKPTPAPPPPPKHEDMKTRPWRLTSYYVTDQESFSGERTVPLLGRDGKKIEFVSANFFSSLALEGSGITGDGRLVNVVGTWVKLDPGQQALYAPVLEYHQKYLSKRPPSYSGLQVDGDKVTKVLTFYEVSHEKFGEGFGICNGIPLSPYRTLAADIGKGKKSDPKFKARGGVVPLGTKVFIKEFVGVTLPDGTTHDGWFTVNDTGGGIFGAHFDVFVGHKDIGPHVPHVGHVWFEGIDALPDPYDYGLEDA